LINIAGVFDLFEMIHDNSFLLAVFILFSLSAVIQLFYYLWFCLAVSLKENQPETNTKKPVSVIICARNEAENLSDFLPSVLEQDYPDYEVIVVNDCSEDNSYDVLGKMLIRYPHLKISNVNKDPKFTHNKKFAQFIGIKAAKNEILLFTDADCQPVSDKWIEGISSHFDDSTSLVLGYGGYFRKRGLLNRYIRYDCMTIALQYLGMAIRGIPYMGVGRNLAYRRSLFFERKGFGSFNHVISGDDDLFVNSNANPYNTAVEFRPGTHTRSVACSSFSSWVLQKKRHLTTGPYYKLKHKILLAIEPVSRIFFFASFIVLLSNFFLWQVALAIFGLRLTAQVIVFALGQKKLNEPRLVGFSLIFDIFSPLVNGFIYLSNLLKRPGKYQWK
jgi:cellulose synthase/poly-beta-1,6-N-acetylglucosamine synthase-like glycosyltransferase